MCIRMAFPFPFPVRLLCIFFCVIACGASNTSPDHKDRPPPPVKDIEGQLIQVYNEVLVLYRQDSAFTKKLEVAQDRWLAYRDAHLEALYPASDKSVAYGSIYPSCYRSEMERLARQRIEELMRWVEGRSEGELCGGSIRMR